jgi:hypothetical protein
METNSESKGFTRRSEEQQQAHLLGLPLPKTTSKVCVHIKISKKKTPASPVCEHFPFEDTPIFCNVIGGKMSQVDTSQMERVFYLRKKNNYLFS